MARMFPSAARKQTNRFRNLSGHRGRARVPNVHAMRGRRLGTAAGVVAMVVAVASPAAVAAPSVQHTKEDRLSAAYAQGIARIKGGWILTGRFVIAKTDEKFRPIKTNSKPIPSEWLKKGYNHVGDIDVAGKYIYAPLEQQNYDLGTQVTARYDLKTLKFIDAVELPQHENSFVTVDAKSKTAYSFDHFGGQALLRYDIKGNKWKPLPPIAMSVFVDKVQGADVANGFAWLSTSNPTNEIYAVDLATGAVTDLGSAGHVPGEGEGIDATQTKTGLLHTMVVDPQINPVWLIHYQVTT